MPDESYTIKEMLQEVRMTQREQVGHMASVRTTLDSLADHFENLAKEVSTQRNQINELNSFKSKAMVVWAFVVFIISTVANKVMENLPL